MLTPTHLVTLTMPPDRGEPTADNLAYLQAACRVFFRWLQRHGLIRHGWVAELGELGGRLHRHCLMHFRDAQFKYRPSTWLPYAAIQEAAARAGLGVVDVEPIFRPVHAARYVAKYLAKQLGAGFAALKARRFALTPGHNLEPALGWSFEYVDPSASESPTPLRLILPSTGNLYALPSISSA